MEKFVTDLNIKYISIASLVCNKEGCLTLANDSVKSLLYFDRHHLTEIGSNYVVSLFKDDPLFQANKP